MSAGPPTRPDRRPPAAAARVHRMRVARGACWVIVAALLGAGALALLDAAARLPGWARGLGLAVWSTTVGVLAWRLVADRLPPDLSGGPAPHPREELPGNLRAAAAAALALAGSLAAASLVPGAGEHLKRVAIPWSRPAAAQYRVVVTSGEPVVRRGGAVTLSAYADKTDPSANAPDAATLVCRDRAGAESRFPMTGDGSGAFHATRPAADFEYRVEVGTAASDWFAVAALDPAEPAAESAVEVSPPRYAPAAARRTFPGFAQFAGFQHGTADVRLRFTRRAATAFLEWRGDGGGPAEVTKLDLAADRQSGTATLRLKQDGTLKLVTVAEQNGKSLRHEVAARVRVTPDTPPRFERVSGVTSRPRTARPGAIMPVAFTTTDDIAVGPAVLEYVVGADDARPAAVPVPLSGEGTPRADGRFDFDLTGKAREGETVRFRVRVRDTRSLDDPELKPQEAAYPETGWSVVRIDPAAPPLDEQEWLAQRDALRDALHAALDEIREAREDAAEVRRATAGKNGLALDHRVRLTNARERLRKAAGLLRGAARDALLTPELRPLAAAVGQLAELQIDKADEGLGKAATDDPARRAAALAAATEALGEAALRADQLLVTNDRLARARLDRKALGLLTAGQVALAEHAKPGGLSPEELAARQRDLLARLRKLAAESGPLHEAASGARQQEFRRLAAAASQLAGMVRDLDGAARQVEAEVRGGLLRAITADQTGLAAEAGVLLAKAETAARLAGVELPRADQFGRAAALIGGGKAVPALVELEGLARKLDAAAAAFEKAVAERADAKAAARHLAAWQDDLRARFRAATGGNAATFDGLPAEIKGAVRAEQDALRTALRSLPLPPGADVKLARDGAAAHLDAAANFLAGTGTNADDAMKFSAEALAKLAEKIPTVSERLTRVRGEFGRVLQLQDSLTAEVEQVIRNADAARRLPAFADRQLRQAAAFAALDLPGLEVRRVRLNAALAAAAADLKDGSPADALASQAWARREFDRLKLVLDGVTSPDDKIDELARKMADVARAAEAIGPGATAKQLEPHAAAVQELTRQWAQLTIPPEAPALFNDADRAVRAADAAARDANPKAAELARRAGAAAAAVTKLADRLTGAESDLDRVRRLAANRRAAAAAEEARRTANKEPDPAAADETTRQLTREIEELTHTRVGAAGQARKKRLLDQYARLRDTMLPDRQVGVHRATAEALDELAGLMADVAELCATFDRTPPAPPAPPAADADAYLPSRPLADALRALARRQQALRGRLTALPDEVVRRTRPAGVNPIADAERKQRDLAAAVTFFARKLEADRQDAAAKEALAAAIDATLAADALANGLVVPARGSAGRAAQGLRPLAADLAARQDALAAEIGKLPVDPAVAAAQLRARGEELARRAGDLARQLELAAQAAEPEAVAAAAVADATAPVKLAEKLITEATRKAADGKSADATRLRAAGADGLKACLEKLDGLLPKVPAPPESDPAAARAAEALGRADAAMRQALGLLGDSPDRAGAERAMRSAAEALAGAVKVRVEVKE